jgi:hypothetical protein
MIDDKDRLAAALHLAHPISLSEYCFGARLQNGFKHFSLRRHPVLAYALCIQSEQLWWEGTHSGLSAGSLSGFIETELGL